MKKRILVCAMSAPSVFEASDSGVMEFRELMMPYMILGTSLQ
jgi:hypothetical protein